MVEPATEDALRRMKSNAKMKFTKCRRRLLVDVVDEEVTASHLKLQLDAVMEAGTEARASVLALHDHLVDSNAEYNGGLFEETDKLESEMSDAVDRCSDRLEQLSRRPSGVTTGSASPDSIQRRNAIRQVRKILKAEKFCERKHVESDTAELDEDAVVEDPNGNSETISETVSGTEVPVSSFICGYGTCTSSGEALAVSSPVAMETVTTATSATANTLTTTVASLSSPTWSTVSNGSVGHGKRVQTSFVTSDTGVNLPVAQYQYSGKYQQSTSFNQPVASSTQLVFSQYGSNPQNSYASTISTPHTQAATAQSTPCNDMSTIQYIASPATTTCTCIQQYSHSTVTAPSSTYTYVPPIATPVTMATGSQYLTLPSTAPQAGTYFTQATLATQSNHSSTVQSAVAMTTSSQRSSAQPRASMLGTGSYVLPSQPQMLNTPVAMTTQSPVQTPQSGFAPIASSPQPPTAYSHSSAQYAEPWKQLRRIGITTFHGDKRKYESFRAAFVACVDKAPAAPEYKLLQLREYLGGEALAAVEQFGYSANAYEAAKALLDRKYGGQRRRIALHLENIQQMPDVRHGKAKDMQQFSELLAITVVNLKDAGMVEELRAGALYANLQKKLDERNLTQYNRWRHERHRQESVETLLEWITLEAEFLTEASETVGGLGSKSAIMTTKLPGRPTPPSRTYFGTTRETLCTVCSAPHQLWKCPDFSNLSLVERWKVAKKSKACYRCLGSGHSGRDCSRSRKCGIDGCHETHHRLLHGKRPQNSSNSSDNNSRGNGNSSANSVSDKASQSGGSSSTEGERTYVAPAVSVQGTSLRTVPVYLINGQKRVKVNALLDDGSTRSYLNGDVAAELGLQGHPEHLTIHTLNGRCETFDTTPVQVELQSINGNVKESLELCTTNKVVGDLAAIDWSNVANKWGHLKEITFPAPAQAGVDLLLGLDYAQFHVSLRDVVGNSGDPIARLTPLGWTCIAPAQAGMRTSVSYTLHARDPDDSTDVLLRRFWEVDSSIVDSETTISSDDQQIISATIASLKRNGTRYEVSVPWRQPRLSLPDNHEAALKRLSSTERRLAKQPAVAAAYDATIQQYLQKGYIRQVPAEEQQQATQWLLPHFPIIKPDKATTKVRIVFDASAQCNGLSLNDAIYQGPKLQQDIVNVLLRFRRHRIALACDISEMYLQIELNPDDRQFHRFLWRASADKPISTYEFSRVVFGVNCSPYLAQLVTQQHARSTQQMWPAAAETVLKSTYMDDSLDSASSATAAIDLYQQLVRLWSDAGMHARKWLSNSKEVLEQIPEADRASKFDLSGNDLPAVKTLGVLYDATTDTFGFNLSPLPEKFAFTKRNVVKKVATIYDPLGFLAPVTVRAKIILQEMWAEGLSWDDPLDPKTRSQVSEWFDDLPMLATLRITRCLQADNHADDVTNCIHVFADASEFAYGAVAYCRTASADQVSVTFVAAPTRVAPLAATSIPRLELMAAVIATRLASVVIRALNLPMCKVVYWTDSMNVLYWIRNRSRKMKTFVANRVSEIQKSTEPAQWPHVPTELNPADVLSRGCSTRDLNSVSWWHGPAFLQQDASEWPQRVIAKIADEEARREEKRETRKSQQATVTMFQKPDDTQSRLAPECFGSWNKFVRTYALVRRFASNCRTQPASRSLAALTPEDLSDAETGIIRAAQHDTFSHEIHLIQRGRSLPSKSELISLNPTVDDDGLLRCQGRLEYADFLPPDTVHPIILPRHHAVTSLIIRHYHELANHVGGTNHVLANLSVRFWIIAGREAIRECERNCARCKLLRARPAQQIMAPLPRSRITPSIRAFARTGIDYAGPFLTVQGRAKKRQKRYLCLFTCLATRAVHLELAYALDTNSFLNAFYRFVSRRGLPELVLSDNGTNFVGAKRELSELFDALDKQQIIRTAADKNLKWEFNPPAAPHFGGVFEAMIKSAKRAVYAILHASDVTDEELATAFVGAESLINSRPLTYQSSNSLDETPLTPNHFLFGQLGGTFAPSAVDTTDFNPRKRWRRVQELVRHFWQRWMREWLPTLSARRKWRTSCPEVKIGDVMLLVSPDTPRGHWPLARVLEVYPGKDGHVRVAKLLIGGKTLVRPIAKLCPLESPLSPE